MKVDLLKQSSPQGLRRPRFSFFRFTCQTARDRAGPSLRRAGEPSKLPASDEHRKLWSPNISEVLHRRDIAPRADDAPYGFYIVLRRVGCQHLINPKSAATKSLPRSSLIAARRSFPRREPVYSPHGGRPKGRVAGKAEKDGKHVREPGHAALRPHSSAVLWVLVGGVNSGVVCARVASSVTRPALPEIG